MKKTMITARATEDRRTRSRAWPLLLAGLLVLAAACGGGEDEATEPPPAEAESAESDSTDEATAADTQSGESESDAADPADDADADADDGSTAGSDDGDGSDGDGEAAAVGSGDRSCDEVASLFAAGPSVNPELADPVSSAVCDGDSIVVTANGIPDYTYIRTSPGDPGPQDYTFVLPADPSAAATTTDVPLLGALGVTLAGVPIYGPTEGTGGDVLSLEGALSECGSHNGPTGFHLHLLGTSTTTDCNFTPDEVAAGPQLLGYAFDGFPIYSGNDQYTSSWALTDESLFASDTWAAHSHVEGSGDLDRCNGRVDEDGNYAYYTTDTFPYVLGCFVGEVELATGGGRGQGGPPGDDGDAAGGGQGPDLEAAAEALGVTVAELEAAVGGPPPDVEAAAEILGVDVELLTELLAPPGGPGGA